MTNSDNDYWGDNVNIDIADFLGRSVVDAIRFRAAANGARVENERFRHDLTQERIKAQELQVKLEGAEARVRELEAIPSVRRTTAGKRTAGA